MLPPAGMQFERLFFMLPAPAMASNMARTSSLLIYDVQLDMDHAATLNGDHMAGTVTANGYNGMFTATRK
jgi:hypothetical protein